MPRLWWALTQDELPRPRWRAPQKYKILYTLFSVCPIWWGCSKGGHVGDYLSFKKFNINQVNFILYSILLFFFKKTLRLTWSPLYTLTCEQGFWNMTWFSLGHGVRPPQSLVKCVQRAIVHTGFSSKECDTYVAIYITFKSHATLWHLLLWAQASYLWAQWTVYQ